MRPKDGHERASLPESCKFIDARRLTNGGRLRSGVNEPLHPEMTGQINPIRAQCSSALPATPRAAVRSVPAASWKSGERHPNPVPRNLNRVALVEERRHRTLRLRPRQPEVLVEMQRRRARPRTERATPSRSRRLPAVRPRRPNRQQHCPTAPLGGHLSRTLPGTPLDWRCSWQLLGWHL